MSRNPVCPSHALTPTARRASHPSLGRILAVLILFLALVAGSTLAAQATPITFTAEELLGKPTNNSVTINIVPGSAIEYYYEYDVDSGAPYAYQTGRVTATAGQPSEVTLTGLTPNTLYYYRMVYDGDGDVDDGDYEVRTEHSFWTQRAPGSTFTFTVTSDSHQNFNPAEQNAMTNILNEHPDFNIDLGDTFLVDGSTTQDAVNTKYLAYREPAYFDKMGHSVPLFLASGNHEDEEGWNLDDSFSLAQASIQARKLYYPTPINDAFYSGNTNILAAINASTYGDQYREDYYAWTWGDALFMVIDEFQYTMSNPYGSVAGEGSDDPKTCDYSSDPNCQWNWTLGAQQYQWFKQTLENSTAKYKFIFSHNMLGGKLSVAGSTGQPGYVRGGCEAAPYFEWGGKNADGSEGFAARRTATYGAGAVPLRQLMMDNGVSAYFHGHDHQYVYETCDNMVYQEVPSPGMSPSGFAEYTEGNHGTYQTVKVLPNTGHLRIMVAPAQATVDYISSASGSNGTVNYSYTIAPNVVADPDYFITATAGANGSISPSGVVGVVAGADQGFTITPNAGYQVADVLVDDVSQGAVTSYTFEDVAADHTISASFSALPQHTITASTGANGSISPSGAVIVTKGNNQSFTITPIGGYQVADVLVDGVSVGAVTSYEFSDVQASHTIVASFEEGAAGVVTLDGVVSSNTGNSVDSITINHTTGTGADRLLLVGVSWNCGDTSRSISSVTFTPSGGSAVALTPVLTQQAGTQLRYSAIYRWPAGTALPSGQAGIVAITFNGSVSNGIVAGAANFAGVDQTTSLGTAAGAGSTSQGTTATVTLTGLGGSELVFDNLFMGGSADTQTVTPGAGQSTPLWNGFAGNARGAASTEQATGSSVTMSWTASESAYWAIAAVPIKPAAAGTTYNLTMATTGNGSTTPEVGVHAYAENAVVPINATPNSGYVFSSWTGDADCADGSVLMNADKGCTANFSPVGTEITFTGEELLGRPTDTSISVKVVPDAAISLYYEYGTTPGVYTGQTDTVAPAAGTPTTVVIGCLSPDTKYYYRMRYTADGGTTWVSRSEHSFWTQRAPGSTFTFDITTDSHVNIQLGNQANWTSTMNGVATDAPDFLIDLGDTFAMDNGSTSVALGDTAAAEQKYKDGLPTFNIASASSAIFLTPGNHEQQEAWHLTASNTGGNPAISLPVMSKNAEKKFFLNPLPDAFYSGDTTTYSHLGPDQYKQDYYAWTWGDALFVVISPFWTTTTKPYTTSTGGGEGDTTGSGNRWDWTLGLDQFNWLKTTLQNSDAKYKFVFTHQIVGGNSMTNQVNYGHGGVDSANFVEWGGYNTDGTTYTWATNRPTWGSQPIRQMMEANGVTAFFHGHDHQMAYERLNGMVYQAVPSGSFTGSFGNYTTGGNSGNTIWADSTQGPGRLKVTVSPTQTTVDFIRYNASSPAYNYTMLPPGGLTLDGAVSSNTADDVSSISFSHTTGSGINPMMLVGVSWNCGSNNRTISSVTFTPSGGSAVNLTPVITQQAGTQLRYSAIYRWPASTPLPSGQAGMVLVSFSDSVSDGIVAGAANFAGVNQTTPLGTAAGVGASAQGTTPSVTLTSLTGNELIFDNVFQGASSSSQTLTPGSGQSQLWNAYVGSTRAAASTEKAAGSSVTMSWTAASSSWWAIAAVPINPAPVSSYNLTVAVVGDGTTDPAAGVHPYATGTSVTVTPAPGDGYVFSHWTGACTGSGACSLTMNADKSVTAHFTVNVDVTVSKSGSNPKLDWLHVVDLVDSYAVYRSLTDPYFVLSNASKLPVEVSTDDPTFTDSTADLTVGGNKYFYLVGPVNDCGGACGSSNRTGAFVYGLVPGSSTP